MTRFSLRLPRVIAVFASVPLGILCISSARADNCTGYDSLVTQSAEMTDLGHGMKQTRFKAESTLFSNDSIYNLVAGECSGTSLQTPDGKTEISGFCARRDKDGDTESIAFYQAPGAPRMEWRATGGTGKFAGKQASGWVQNVLADGKIAVSKWGGNCH